MLWVPRTAPARAPRDHRRCVGDLWVISESLLCSDRFLQCPSCGCDVQMSCESKGNLISSLVPVKATWDGFSTNTHQEMTHQSTQESETIHKSPTHLLWSLGARAGAIRCTQSTSTASHEVDTFPYRSGRRFL